MPLTLLRPLQWGRVMDVTGIDADVPAHVSEGAQEEGYQPPQSWSVLLRDGDAESKNEGGDREAEGRRGARGRNVQVLLPGGGIPTVESLLDGLREIYSTEGTALEPPTWDDFAGGAPELLAPK